MQIYVASESGTAVELGTGTETALTIDLPSESGEVLRGITTVPGQGAMAYAAALHLRRAAAGGHPIAGVHEA